MKVLSIGRNPDCNIVYEDMMVSRRHALIKIYPTGKYEIISTGSNGTKVNGNQISSNAPYPLKRGDSVTFANVARLDWNQVPNPLLPFRYAFFGLIGVAVAVGLGMGVSKIVKSYSDTSSEGGVTTEQETSPTTKPDSVKTDTIDKAQTPSLLGPENIEKPEKLEKPGKTGTKPPKETKKKNEQQDKSQPQVQEAEPEKEAPEATPQRKGWRH